MLAFMTSPQVAGLKRRHGMEPAEEATAMIIDCHGHYTTAPKALEAWRNAQIAGIKDPAAKPRVDESEDSRRRAARVDRGQPAQADEAARLGPHDLQPARQLHGASHRRLSGVEHLGRDLQRAVLPRVEAVPRSLHPGGDAAAIPGRRPQDLHSRTGEVRRAVRQRRHQPEPRSVGRPLDFAAAHRQALVPDLREDGRVRHPGDDPREHELQRVFPHHRRALHQRRHHRGDATDPG